jgi:hypothetical protein
MLLLVEQLNVYSDSCDNSKKFVEAVSISYSRKDKRIRECSHRPDKLQGL